MKTAVSKPWPFWFHELVRSNKYQAYMKAKREAAWKAQEEEFARQRRIAQQKREIAKQQRANDLMRQSQRVSLTAGHTASSKPASGPVSRSRTEERKRRDDDDGFSTYQDSWTPTHHRNLDPEPSKPAYSGRGGSFDGGGASGDWDRPSSSSSYSSSSDSGSSSSSSSDSSSSSSSSSSD